MSELILVQHGQATTNATDEESYDQLSDLGRQQATWLGAYFSQTGQRFDRVVTGSLKRQQQTAAAMGYTIDDTDARLDELRYFDLTRAVERQFSIPAPSCAREFARYMPQVIGHWSDGVLEDIPERFEDFAARTEALVADLCAAGGRSLVVTSGGVISMILRRVLNLDTHATTLLMLQTMNTSVHHVAWLHDRLVLAGYNATPHLVAPERAHARTFI